MPKERESLCVPGGIIYIVDRYLLQHDERNYNPLSPG
jgi:hypothetical protein